MDGILITVIAGVAVIGFLVYMIWFREKPKADPNQVVVENPPQE